MTKVSKYCLGCGTLLQTNDNEKLGYVSDIDKKLCRDCYQLLHYGISNKHIHPNSLPKIDVNSTIFIITPIFNLDMLFEYPIQRYQPDANYVYIINQVDLLPISTNLDLMMENIIKKARERNIKYQDIILMSALNNEDINNLKQYINNLKTDKIYLIGVQNSGKTTIFKKLTNNDDALALNKAALTQYPLFGTYNNKNIIDMPGLYQKGYLHEFFEYETYKKYLPLKRFKPKVYQYQNKVFLIEDFILIKNQSEKPIVFYFNQQIKITNVNIKKYQDYKFDNNFEYEKKIFKNEFGLTQITIADFGFIHLNGKFNIEITLPKNMHLTITKGLFR